MTGAGDGRSRPDAFRVREDGTKLCGHCLDTYKPSEEGNSRFCPACVAGFAEEDDTDG